MNEGEYTAPTGLGELLGMADYIDAAPDTGLTDKVRDRRDAYPTRTARGDARLTCQWWPRRRPVLPVVATLLSEMLPL